MIQRPMHILPALASFRARESNLVIRVTVGVIAAPLLLFIVFLGGLPMAVLIAAAVAVGLFEYYRLVRGSPGFPYLIAVGAAYLTVPLVLTWFIRNTAPNGLAWIVAMLMANWATDTGAYAGGRLFGRHKLAPRISPNKTVEGAITGVIVGSVIGWLILLAAGLLSGRTAFVPPIVGVSVVIGDLLESALKRRFSVKDSGHLIPGHGGILDRIDGTLVAAIAASLYLLLTGGF